MRKKNRATPTTLFPTAAELDVPPVPFHDGDLSRIRVFTDPNDPEWLAYCDRRAERTAKRNQLEGIAGDLARLVVV